MESRAKNAKRNIAFGFILKAYQLLIPFLMRTAMIYLMGVQYLGLNSLFASIIQVLNLAELGVGAAMVYSMYKPAAECNREEICALLNLYKVYYRVIGLLIAVVGIGMTPFVPRLINGDIPSDINIYIIYLLNLGATVLSYWLFAYKNSLLQAHQRADVVSKVTLITNSVQYLVQILILWYLHDYYVYLITALVTQAINNVITGIVATKMYPDYQPKGKVEKEERKVINQKIKDLFTSKLGFVIVNSADSIVISAFLGLTILAEYQNYYYIINAITGFIFVINGSITAGIGNSMVTESLDKNYHDFKKYNFILFWMLGFCISCFISLMQPFMEIWVGEELMLPFEIVVLLSIYFFSNVIERSISNFKDACGLWHEDRFRPMIYGFSNLILNIILVKNIGLNGVILSTIVTCLIISVPWLIYVTFKILYKRSAKEYLVSICKYTVIIGLVATVTWLMCSLVSINKYADLMIKICICAIVPNIVFAIIYKSNPLFKECIQLVMRK